MDTNNEYGTKAIQNELLPLLKDFHGFCIDNDIQYSLAYGSLLGAVRHKGFIPWDDDVDVIVTRENFKKLRSSIVNYPRFTWDYFTKSSLWLGRIKRANHVSKTKIVPTIDVFILDNVPDNVIVAKIKLFLICFLQGSIKKKPNLSRFKFYMKICAYTTFLLGRLLPNGCKYIMYERISEWSNNKITKSVCCYNTIFGYLNKTYSSVMISNYILSPFEDTELYVMNGYDEFLTQTYGDYMTPPENKVGHHLHPEYRYSYK